jgi:hypothetical protein
MYKLANSGEIGAPCGVASPAILAGDWKVIPEPNKQERREFYTLSDLLQLKLSDLAYILLFERIQW